MAVISSASALCHRCGLAGARGGGVGAGIVTMPSAKGSGEEVELGLGSSVSPSALPWSVQVQFLGRGRYLGAAPRTQRRHLGDGPPAPRTTRRTGAWVPSCGQTAYIA